MSRLLYFFWCLLFFLIYVFFSSFWGTPIASATNEAVVLLRCTKNLVRTNTPRIATVSSLSLPPLVRHVVLWPLISLCVHDPLEREEKKKKKWRATVECNTPLCTYRLSECLKTWCVYTALFYCVIFCKIWRVVWLHHCTMTSEKKWNIKKKCLLEINHIGFQASPGVLALCAFEWDAVCLSLLQHCCHFGIHRASLADGRSHLTRNTLQRNVKWTH